MKRLMVALAVVAFLAACTEAIPASGVFVTEERQVTSFERVAAEMGAIVRITVDDSLPSGVTVTYDDNVIEDVVTDVSDDTLVVRVDAEVSFSRSGQDRGVDVTMPTLRGLDLSGGSVVSVTGVSGDLALGSSGGSVVAVGGTSGSVTLEASGGSVVTLTDLSALKAEIDVSGGSVVTMRVSDVVSGSASGGSVVTIEGNPATVAVEASGGSLVSTP